MPIPLAKSSRLAPASPAAADATGPVNANAHATQPPIYRYQRAFLPRNIIKTNPLGPANITESLFTRLVTGFSFPLISYAPLVTVPGKIIRRFNMEKYIQSTDRRGSGTKTGVRPGCWAACPTSLSARGASGFFYERAKGDTSDAWL